MPALLEVKNLAFNYYGQSELLFKNFNLQLQINQSLFIKGSSGVGKTTLLNLLSGLLLPQQGEIHFEGVSLASLNDAERAQLRAQKLGVIYQDFSLLPYLNIQQNIFLPHYLSKIEVTEDLIANFQELMHRFGLSNVTHQAVNQLSRGQKQRVAVIRSLMQRPRCILADEPTSALDPDNAKLLIEQILSFCQDTQCSLIFVSHDWNFESRFDQSLTLEVQAIV